MSREQFSVFSERDKQFVRANPDRTIVSIQERPDRPERGADIGILLGEKGYDLLSQVTRKRSKTLKRRLVIEEVVLEAFRVEQLLADGKLEIKDGWSSRPLYSV